MAEWCRQLHAECRVYTIHATVYAELVYGIYFLLFTWGIICTFSSYLINIPHFEIEYVYFVRGLGTRLVANYKL